MNKSANIYVRMLCSINFGFKLFLRASKTRTHSNCETDYMKKKHLEGQLPKLLEELLIPNRIARIDTDYLHASLFGIQWRAVDNCISESMALH